MIAPRLFATGYRFLLKPLLFSLRPETTHDLFINLGRKCSKSPWFKKILQSCFSYQHESLQQTWGDLTFVNPVGLSAGFDKNGDLPSLMADVGFGFTQVGSITRDSYEGNPLPRAERLRKLQGLIVNYGLKNEGASTILPKLLGGSPIPVSISLAKTNCERTTDTQQGIQDYVRTIGLAEQLQVGNIYTLNISCPNAYGGEPYTTPELLNQLLTNIRQVQPSKPIRIKMPLELPWSQYSKLCEVAISHNVQALILANLLKDRSQLSLGKYTDTKGGISGKPTEKIVNQLISQTYLHFGDEIKIIGVGGVFSAADAYEKIKRGASLIQLITGMIYKGPQLIGQINKGLVQRMRKDGYEHISEVVGAYHR